MSPQSKPQQLRLFIRAGLCILLSLLLLSGCAVKQALQGILSPSDPPADQTSVPGTGAVTPEPTPISTQCRQPYGSVSRIHFYSEILKDDFYASVYTPPCYQAADVEGYPVLYLLHGQSQNDQFWIHLGITDLADEAILSGRRPFLIVMPYEEKNYDPVTESMFGQAFMDEMIPWIEVHYAVSSERADHAIGGISRGGGWAIHLALQNLETFGALGAHSPGVFGFDWVKVGRLLETRTVDDFPRIAIDRGDEDYLYEATDQFAEALVNNNVPHEYIIQPGQHAEKYWQAHTADYLDWYMQGWDPQENPGS